MKKFSRKVIEALGYYVYIYLDPRENVEALGDSLRPRKASDLTTVGAHIVIG